MPDFPVLLLLPGLLFIGFSISLCFLAFSAYYRLKGLERAAWAIVSQLQAMRREERGAVGPDAALRPLDVAGSSGKISLSMFGR